MTTDDEYKIEKEFIAKKVPTVVLEWTNRTLIEQILSPLQPKEESDRVYNKLCEAFKPRAGMRLGQLVKQVCPDPSKGLYRIAISIKLLRELFANELSGWGGGGGKGLKKIADPLATTMRRR